MTTNGSRSTVHQYSAFAGLAWSQAMDNRAHCPEGNPGSGRMRALCGSWREGMAVSTLRSLSVYWSWSSGPL